MLLCLTVFCPLSAQEELFPSENVRIAFVGDQGLGWRARRVLKLIKREEADLVVHLGDLDYKNKPLKWQKQFEQILGSLPVLACAGNHDEAKWYGLQGYQAMFMQRARRTGLTWNGEFGVKCAATYKGIFFVLTAPGSLGLNHDTYIERQLKADQHLWRICAWHKNQRVMNVGYKDDETGWGVYQAALDGGAIIATAHDHTYSRSYLLSSVNPPVVVSTANVMTLEKGHSFVFVSGLGGKSIYKSQKPAAHWASMFTRRNGKKFGALFGIFNVHGNPRKAYFYFKTTDGVVRDRFWVTSKL